MNAGSRARLSDRDTFEHQGYAFRVRIERDDHMGEPWKEHDGHGPVSEWTTRDKRAGERVLSEDHGSKRYYDFSEAVRIARTDQWGPVHCHVCGLEAGGIGTPAYGKIHAVEPMGHTFKPEPKGVQAARAAEADFAHLQAWCRDEWEWLSVDVEHLDDDGEPTGERESLGGIEDPDGTYCTDVAYELAAEIAGRLETKPITLRLICEVADVRTLADARAKLDAFREAVVPSANYGLTFYEPTKGGR